MAKNVVQFQKGLSEAAFQSQYGTEEQCRTALFSWRWPQGFVCPKCEGFKGRVATYIERIQFRREAPWTRSARTARVSV